MRRVLAFSGFTILAASRGNADAPDLAIVVFGLATLGWAIFPVLGFGTDETLDPQRLATLPLTRRQLVTGVFAASLVGVAPLATLVAFSGALVGLAHNLTSAALIAIAAVESLLLCVVASRTIVALHGSDPPIAPRTRLHHPGDDAHCAHATAARAVRARAARTAPTSTTRSSTSPIACASPRSRGAEPRWPTRRAGTTGRPSSCSS